MHDESTERSFPSGGLYLVVSGAPAPEGVPALVRRCQKAGWREIIVKSPDLCGLMDQLDDLFAAPANPD